MMSNLYDGKFYDADYFERGKVSGKGWLMNYRWMPRRSFREAFAYIDKIKLDENSKVLDVGCAKGFLVRALRELEIPADGCDISDYALSFAPHGCWNCSEKSSWEERKNFGYTNVVAKDVFEHMTPDQLTENLTNISIVCNKIMCVVPMGDNGKYRIPEYHLEISHIIAEDERWWYNKFENSGWKVIEHCDHVPGLKDNWQNFAEGKGNHVFLLSKP